MNSGWGHQVHIQIRVWSLGWSGWSISAGTRGHDAEVHALQSTHGPNTAGVPVHQARVFQACPRDGLGTSRRIPSWMNTVACPSISQLSSTLAAYPLTNPMTSRTTSTVSSRLSFSTKMRSFTSTFWGLSIVVPYNNRFRPIPGNPVK